MRIKMILDNGFFPDVRVYKEATYLVNIGHDVEILCIDTKNQYIDRPIEIVNGVKIRRFFCRTEKITAAMEKNFIIRKFKKLIYIMWFIKFFNQIRGYLKDEPYDALHCHDLNIAFMSLFYFRKKPMIFDMHEYYAKFSNKFKNYLIEKMVDVTQNRAKYIIFVSEKLYEEFSGKNAIKKILIPNYPILSEYSTEKSEDEKFRVSYIGAIRDKQVMYNLCIACKDLNNVKISIHGIGLNEVDGNKINEINQGAFYYGAFDGSKKARELFRNCDLSYVIYDTGNKNWAMSFPVKLFESLASCTPTIVSKNSAAGDFVKEHNIGYVVNWNSIEEIRASVITAITDKEDYTSKIKNIKKLRELYSWEMVAKELDFIYKNL